MTKIEELIALIKEKNPKKIFWMGFYMCAALGLGIFHLYTSAFGIIESWQQKAVHLGFVLLIAFTLPFVKGEFKEGKYRHLRMLVNIVCLIVSCVYFFYIRYDVLGLQKRAGIPNQMDTIMFFCLVVLLLISSKKYIGWPLPIIASIFVVYLFWGQYLPGPLRHGGYSIRRIVDSLFLTGNGIFGPALYASAVFIVVFIIFGNFLVQTKVGDYFVQFASAIAGGYTGGPAKVAVIASALMGTIHGSGPGNVATTGTFTIPLMKRLGYKPYFSGAVEAAASTGGIIMPPVMGATAFIIAEMTGIPYSRIALAAVIPAFLYFYSIFCIVHLEAIKENLSGVPESELPDKKELMKEIYLFSPIIAIIVFLIMGSSPMKAGFYGIVVTIIVSCFKKDTRLNFKRFITALEGGSSEVVSICLACGTAGIIAGIISLTGLGVKMSYVISTISQGQLIPALIMTMIVCIILGMGMPVTAAYILVAATTTTILTKMGLNTLTSAFFMFFYATLSAVTPPVALSSYTAAGIAGADMNKTGFEAVKLCLAAFIIPFMFVYSPELLWEGELLDILRTFITGTIGVTCLAVSVHGWHLKGKTSLISRVALFASALLMIDSKLITDITGIVIIVSVYAFERFRMKSSKKAQA